MKTITLKKKWIEKLEGMDKELKHKCVVALYEYLHNGYPTVEMKENIEVFRFMKFVIEDIRQTEERRNRNSQRRAEKAAREAAEKEYASVHQPDDDKKKTAKNLYEINPELYIFDGFMRYIIATGKTGLNRPMPVGTTLDNMLSRFRGWVLSRRRLREITHLSAFQSLFNQAIQLIA